MDGWLPTKVIIADFVDGALTTDPCRDIGPEVGRLEVLVRRDGRPVGMVSLDVPDEPAALRTRAWSSSLETVRLSTSTMSNSG